jgi:hypothetical protein
MRKLLVFPFICLAVVATAQADTIHLKNGSVLKGKVTSFADEQFIVMLDTGSGRYLSRAQVYIGDVARIDFDSAPAASATDAGPVRDTATATQPSEPAPRNSTLRDPQPRGGQPTDTQTRIPSSSEPRDTTPAEPAPSREPAREPVREPETSQPEKPAPSTPVVDTSDSDRVTRKPSKDARVANIDVSGKRDWTSTGMIVKRGDRIHITATGLVTLDPATGRTTGPEGVADLPDPKKLMPDQPTGALIGVIGADNDDFIYVGRSSDFTATRDGLLFLSVNEGSLTDNAGAYRATVEVQTSRAK